MNNVVNCTPHEITIIRDSENIVISKCENPCRVSTTRRQTSSVGEIPVNQVEFGEITNLPDDCPPDGWHSDKVNNFFIVSRIVAEAVKNSDLPQEFKNKFLVVDETVRDSAGRIIGCKSFARV